MYIRIITYRRISLIGLIHAILICLVFMTYTLAPIVLHIDHKVIYIHIISSLNIYNHKVIIMYDNHFTSHYHQLETLQFEETPYIKLILSVY